MPKTFVHCAFPLLPRLAIADLYWGQSEGEETGEDRGEGGGVGGGARDARGGGGDAGGDAGVSLAQVLAPGVTRSQQIQQRRHLASLHYKQILRRCIGAQMAATYHTAGLAPHFSLTCNLLYLSPFFPVFPFPQSATPSHLYEIEPPLLLSSKPSSLRQIRAAFKGIVSFLPLPAYPSPLPLVFIPRLLTFPSNHSTAPDESFPSCHWESHLGSRKKWQHLGLWLNRGDWGLPDPKF